MFGGGVNKQLAVTVYVRHINISNNDIFAKLLLWVKVKNVELGLKNVTTSFQYFKKNQMKNWVVLFENFGKLLLSYYLFFIFPRFMENSALQIVHASPPRLIIICKRWNGGGSEHPLPLGTFSET